MSDARGLDTYVRTTPITTAPAAELFNLLNWGRGCGVRTAPQPSTA